VKLKDGTPSAGKRILIDGQQRVTALMAALLAREVLTKDYETVRIRIAFHPLEEKFEVSNPAIRKNNAWIPDVSEVFSPDAKLLQITRAYPPEERNNYYAVQVKEKFGLLNFYMSRAAEEMRSLIGEAEGKSASTCEECGQPGKLRGGALAQDSVRGPCCQ
jgi:uncharacterized protein with ParB-like and HNH nuclease domain